MCIIPDIDIIRFIKIEQAQQKMEKPDINIYKQEGIPWKLNSHSRS